MKELQDLKDNGLVESGFTFSSKKEARFIQEGHENEKIARNTSKSDRDFYRNQGYNPKGKSMFQIASELQLPTIYEAPIGYNNHFNSHVKALHLEDGTLLDVVNEKWKVIQPVEILGLFLDFCEQNGLEVEKVGTFKHERSKENENHITDVKQTYSLFISSKLNDSYEVTEGDKISGKLVFKCPYINGKGYSAGILSLRQVCTNGLFMPVKIKQKVVGHIGEFQEKRIKEMLEQSKKVWREDKLTNTLFSSTECTELEAVMCLVNCFSTVQSHKEIAAQALYELKHGGSIDAVNTIYFSSFWDKECALVKECIDLFKHGGFTGSSFDGTKNTMWGLLNVLTEYLNWKGKQQKDKTLASILGGNKANQMLKFKTELTKVSQIKKEKTGVKVFV